MAEEEERGGTVVGPPSRSLTLAASGSPKRDRWTLVGATVAMLVPFVTKPLNIDDPLFVWAARQIRSHPTDPYGFVVNWYGIEMKMAEVTKNPPGWSYVLALSVNSEVGMHLLGIVAAIGAILGIYELGRGRLFEPKFAGLLLLVSPGFLVSATSLMCDVPMLALWIWALVAWLRAVDSGSARWFALAGLLAGAAALTKYFGMSLLGLFALHAWLKRVPVKRALLSIGSAVLMLAAYQGWTRGLYGRGLLTDAAHYSSSLSGGARGTGSVLAGIAFLGGSGLSLALPILAGLSSKAKTLCALATGLAVFAMMFWGDVSMPGPGSFWTHAMVFLSLGIALLIGVWRWRLEPSTETGFGWLVLAWAMGTLVFAALLNWTVNVRSLLPALGALSLVGAASMRPLSKPVQRLIVAVGVALSLLVAEGDREQAEAGRRVAAELNSEFGRARPLWFQGHWGFQYYMEQWGARPLDFRRGIPDDALVIVPGNNTNVRPLDLTTSQLVARTELIAARWVSTMSVERRAGFYSSQAGILPFRWGGHREAFEVFGPVVERGRPGGADSPRSAPPPRSP